MRAHSIDEVEAERTGYKAEPIRFFVHFFYYRQNNI
jgi:hypothetical protein